MSMSTGTKSLLGQALSWVAIAFVGAAILVNIDVVSDAAKDAISKQGVTGTNASARQLAKQSNRHANPISNGSVRIPRGSNGHYYARVSMNGRPIDVLVDTGASLVALTYEDAQRAGIYVKPSDFTARSRTANGIARSAIVRISRIEIGGITVRNVRGSVAEPDRLHVTLLGMSFLGQLARVEMRDGDLHLQN